ncbi:MAG: 3-isopropylmalate dehydratase small subunit [Thermoguttaceae bacterium]|nr:3-isopropylmalate dehydratase small subunit [Thermoguttaceae bacterium]
MKPFTKHTGIVVPMDRSDVDTDQLVPKQFLKRIERSGFGKFLFYDWRYLDDGSDNPEFELNFPQYKGATILLARRNFGCGSSREHAPWAVADYGFRVVIASSFADIFFNNSFKNGILLVRLSEEEIDDLFKRAAAHENYKLTVDLEVKKITDDYGLDQPFEIDEFRRTRLLRGLDDIALTLQNEADIAAYEKTHGIV